MAAAIRTPHSKIRGDAPGSAYALLNACIYSENAAYACEKITYIPVYRLLINVSELPVYLRGSQCVVLLHSSQGTLRLRQRQRKLKRLHLKDHMCQCVLTACGLAAAKLAAGQSPVYGRF